jgi:hypothetical protein
MIKIIVWEVSTTENEAEWIYRALQLAQEQYFSGEQTFPLWESIHAVVISGLFVVYITLPANNLFLRIITCLIAIIFSIAWSAIINRSAIYSFARMDRVEYLENLLDEQYPGLFNSREDTLKRVGEKEQWYSQLNSWRVRRIVPVCLLGIWLILLIYTLQAPLGLCHPFL